jgi:trimeric autotransporter adhesin
MRQMGSFKAASISTLLVAVLGGSVGIASAQSACTAGQTSALFSFTGGVQTVVVPPLVSSAVVHVKGAQGGAGAIGGNSVVGGTGGLGATVTGTLALTPGTTLNILVGGQGATPLGGFNGGANGGSQNAGGGGGASDIRIGGTAAANRVVTAGGGGGGGRGGCHEGSGVGGVGGVGGAGGGGAGVNGADSPQSSGVAGGGAGAIGSAGGAVGIGCGGFLGTVGSTATTENGGTGGNGQTCCCSSSNSIPGGGGGGGGFVGGGGGGGGSAGTTGCAGNSKGAGGGGAGGTTDASALTASTATNGVQLGDGSVEVCFIPDTADLSITKTDGVTSVAAGGSTTYTITASNAGPTGVTGATVADTFPADLTCTWTCAGAGGGTCTASGAGNINDSVNLPSGGSVTYSASCSIAPTATGMLTNTATVTSSTTDPTPGNNSATDTNTITALTFVVTGMASPTAGGSVSCAGPVAFGNTTTCTVSPNAGYVLTSISGCGGTPTSATTYVTGPMTAACVVSAAFAQAAAEAVPVFGALWAWLLAAITMIASGIALRRRSGAAR